MQFVAVVQSEVRQIMSIFVIGIRIERNLNKPYFQSCYRGG